ncbi:MAG: hypothetical protein WA655_03020, partial [Candidatus Korobacteraceae bacterium]
MVRDTAIIAVVVCVLVLIVAINVSHKPASANPSKVAAAPSVSEADQHKTAAELKQQQTVCDKYIKLAFRSGVLHSYRGP